MKYYELEEDEKRLLDEFEKGIWKSAGRARQQRAVYQKYAQATLNKTRNINIRLPEKDLLKVKSKAAARGVPYQTLLASIIHQYSTDQIQDRAL